ncbi:MAG: DUF6361 family protein [Thermoanaerobaculia bacterium]
MISSLTWLDYSERDRRRALDVIDLFRERETVDELGIGSVRDAFSDLLFPGTSTIQTRACYFLHLPWIFRWMEERKVPSARAADKARDLELHLNDRLRKGPDEEGVFGSLAGRALKRLPSQAYWGGLGTWGIRLFPGHLDAYFRSLDEFYRRRERHRRRSWDVEDPEAREAAPANWHPHLPEAPKGFPWEASVALRPEDADYLADRIQSLHAGTLLAELVAARDPEALDAESPWDLPAVLDLPPAVREKLHHAGLFAVVLHGAALLYNLMLAQAAENDRWIQRYERRLGEWTAEVAGRERDFREWELPRLWEVVEGIGRRAAPSALGDGPRPKVPIPTRLFVERWVEIVRSRGPERALREGSGARRLIRDREARLKGGRARLRSRRHLELWGGNAGSRRLDFRWRSARRILQDVFDGLGATSAAPGTGEGGGSTALGARDGAGGGPAVDARSAPEPRAAAGGAPGGTQAPGGDEASDARGSDAPDA